MLWNANLSHYLTQLMKEEWQKANLAEWLCKPDTAEQAVHAILNAELEKEKELDQEVKRTLDQLEQSHTGQFERYKMHPLLKKKLAEKKGIIL